MVRVKEFNPAELELASPLEKELLSELESLLLSGDLQVNSLVIQQDMFEMVKLVNLLWLNYRLTQKQ